MYLIVRRESWGTSLRYELLLLVTESESENEKLVSSLHLSQPEIMKRVHIIAKAFSSNTIVKLLRRPTPPVVAAPQTNSKISGSKSSSLALITKYQQISNLP